jgi:hypothetical protein
MGLKKLCSLIPFGSIKKISWVCVTTQKIKFVFLSIGRGLVYIALAIGTWLTHYCPAFCKGVASFFSFFWNMFMAWKSKNCPAIIWKD